MRRLNNAMENGQGADNRVQHFYRELIVSPKLSSAFM